MERLDSRSFFDRQSAEPFLIGYNTYTNHNNPLQLGDTMTTVFFLLTFTPIIIPIITIFPKA